MKRTEILDGAKMAVSGDRYGSPEDNFGRIADLWEGYLNAVHDPEDCTIIITAEDVAVMMILLKIARIESGHGGLDSWIDICGYSACGGEIATKGFEPKGWKAKTAEELMKGQE